MGGVFIKKAVLNLWSIVVIISLFVLGAVGADLQCTDSQIRELVQNHHADSRQISETNFWCYIQEMYAHIAKDYKKLP